MKNLQIMSILKSEFLTNGFNQTEMTKGKVILITILVLCLIILYKKISRCLTTEESERQSWLKKLQNNTAHYYQIDKVTGKVYEIKGDYKELIEDEDALNSILTDRCLCDYD